MNLIQNNPYRILGLLVGVRPIEKRKQILQLKKNYETELLSESKSEVDYCFPSLGKINRTLKNIEDAEVKLDNNNDQINSALFWFYTGRMSTDYSAFEALKLGNTNQAMEIWSSLITDSTITRANASAYFNLSTLLLSNITDGKSIKYDQLKQALELKLRFFESKYINNLIHKIGLQDTSIKSGELQNSFLKSIQSELFSQDGSELVEFENIIRGLQFTERDRFLIGIEQQLVAKPEPQNIPEDALKEDPIKEPFKIPIEPVAPSGVGKESDKDEGKLGIVLISIFAFLFIVLIFTISNSNSRANREYDSLNIENSIDSVADEFIDTSGISIEMKDIISRYCKATISNDYADKLEAYRKLTKAVTALILDETPDSINISASKLSNFWKSQLNNLITNEEIHENRLDGLARSPKTLFKIFVKKINSGNCQEAFLYQANPLWENVFCSANGFGRLKDIRLYDVRYMYADDKVSELFINYRAIDYNSEKVFLQKVVIEKKIYNGRYLWVVTNIIDLFPSLESPENTIFYEGIVLRDTQMVIPFVEYTNNSFEHPETFITNNMRNSIPNIYYHVNSTPLVFKITNGKVEQNEKVLSFVQNIDYYLNDTTIIESKNIIGITKHMGNSNFYCNNYTLRSNSNTFKPEFEKEHTYYLPDGNSYTVSNEKELLGYIDLNNDGVNEYFYRVIDADGCYYDWHYEIYQYSTHNSWQMVYKSYNYTLRENSNTDFE